MVEAVPVELLIRDFTLPDAAHASQWTESDPFGGLEACNMIAVSPRPPGCVTNHTNFPHNEEPCLTTSTVDAYYKEMSDHRINRVAWMYSYDMVTSVGLTIANDTQSVQLDTDAFDANFEKLLALGYRDLKLPVPACTSGSSCAIQSASGISPNATWFFGNSSGFKNGHGWVGNCEGSSGCVGGQPLGSTIEVPVFQNKSLNAPSKRNASLPSWETQEVGDEVELNDEFRRLFLLVMSPMAKHMRAKGWINRTFAFITDEPRWPSYSGTNFTVNAWVVMAKLYKSLDSAIRIQQDLTPMMSASDDATWEATGPLVNAWVWQEGEFGFGVPSGGKPARIEAQLERVAQVRNAGNDVRCSFSDRNFHSRMPLSFTPLLHLKRLQTCDQ
jgi:hypothetical protein